MINIYQCVMESIINELLNKINDFYKRKITVSAVNLDIRNDMRSITGSHEGTQS